MWFKEVFESHPHISFIFDYLYTSEEVTSAIFGCLLLNTEEEVIARVTGVGVVGVILVRYCDLYT